MVLQSIGNWRRRRREECEMKVKQPFPRTAEYLGYLDSLEPGGRANGLTTKSYTTMVSAVVAVHSLEAQHKAKQCVCGGCDSETVSAGHRQTAGAGRLLVGFGFAGRVRTVW